MAEFRKDRLIELARENVRVLTLAAKQHPGQSVIAMDLRLAEMALALLTDEEMTGGKAMTQHKIKGSNYKQWTKGWNSHAAWLLRGIE